MGLLSELAVKHGTDKWGHHYYTEIYEKYFASRKDKKFLFMELGIGGYEHPDRGGESLRMWNEYFTQAIIAGVDKYKKSFFIGERVRCYESSQDDIELIEKILDYWTPTYQPEIIIDDASHINPLTIRTFEILFPKLQPGGMYVVEDAHTSYWEEPGADGTNFGGTRDIFANPRTSIMNYFKAQCDAIMLGACEYDIESIHFYKELIIILKK